MDQWERKLCLTIPSLILSLTYVHTHIQNANIHIQTYIHTHTWVHIYISIPILILKKKLGWLEANSVKTLIGSVETLGDVKPRTQCES